MIDPESWGYEPGSPNNLPDSISEPNIEEIYYNSERVRSEEEEQYVTYLERHIRFLNNEIQNLKYPKTTLTAEDLRNITKPRQIG